MLNYFKLYCVQSTSNGFIGVIISLDINQVMLGTKLLRRLFLEIA